MRKIESAWGIEIGTTALKAVGVQVSESGRARLRDFHIIPWTGHALAGDRVGHSEAIRQAVTTLKSKIAFNDSTVFVSLRDGSCYQKTLSIPGCEEPIGADYIEQLAFARIPIERNEVAFNFQLLDVKSRSALPPEHVAVFAARHEIVAEAIEPLLEAKLPLDGIVTSATALANAWHFNAQNQRNSSSTSSADAYLMLLDLGAKNSVLVVTGPQIFWCRNFSWGGDEVTKRLSSTFGWTAKKTEQAKRNSDRIRDKQQFMQVLRLAYDELVDQMKRSLAAMASDGLQIPHDLLVVTGGSCRLPGLPRFLEQQLRIDTTTFDQYSWTPMNSSLQKSGYRLAVAVGLALTAGGVGRISASLPARKPHENRLSMRSVANYFRRK